MEFYFHHVGQIGSEEDFPKTILATVDLERIVRAIPRDDPYREDIVQTLRSRFPEGSCNVWGVPVGARIAMGRFQHGAAVLLVESVSGDGSVPALCPDILYWNRAYFALSQELWGNPRFPYVFYFRTEPLDLTWREMATDLGYASNWSPRNFFRIPDDRLEPFSGAAGYLAHVRRLHGVTDDPFAPADAEDLEAASNGDVLDAGDVSRELAALRARVVAPPVLTEGLEPRLRQVLERPRSAAFQLAVRRAYGGRCAICGSALRGPDGEVEVESAHLYPKQLDGRDDVRNGLCLCRRHHWALDVGWIAIADDLTVLVRQDLPDGDDYRFIRKIAGCRLAPPVDASLAPDPLYLRHHRALNGFAES